MIASVLDVTITAWPLACATRGLTNKSPEEDFTGALVEHMQAVKDARALPFLILEETGTRHRGARKPTGRIDIRVHHDFREQNYLGIECKRVHGKRKKLAVHYVEQGAMRFISAKYSPGHETGVLIGFAIDGDCDACAQLVSKTLDAWPNAAAVKGWTAELGYGPVPDLSSTQHTQAIGGSTIALLHLFLPFRPARTAA